MTKTILIKTDMNVLEFVRLEGKLFVYKYTRSNTKINQEVKMSKEYLDRMFNYSFMKLEDYIPPPPPEKIIEERKPIVWEDPEIKVVKVAATIKPAKVIKPQPPKQGSLF